MSREEAPGKKRSDQRDSRTNRERPTHSRHECPAHQIPRRTCQPCGQLLDQHRCGGQRFTHRIQRLLRNQRCLSTCVRNDGVDAVPIEVREHATKNCHSE